VRFRFLIAAPALLAGTTIAAAAPVEITRFHTPQTLAQLGPGALVVAPAPGIDAASLETRVWIDAVSRALARQGFPALAGGAARVAEVRLTSDRVEGFDRGGPRSSVSVGVGNGWGGGWHRGSHVGLGIGLGLGGSRRSEQVESELSVVIRDAATRAPLWEGRAITWTRAGARDADPARLAERLAEALFAGFPGRSGETIEVR
jgi:hypothetical protein